MTLRQFLLGLICVSTIAIGQILFKLSASQLSKQGNIIGTMLQFINIYFITSLVIYAFATVLWVWLLRELTLSKAYPLMSMAFFIVPILSSCFLGESLEIKVLIGAALIVLGVIISVR